MKRILLVFAAVALLVACQGKENPSGGGEVTAISLNKTSITLEKGGNEVLSVSFTPSNASDKTVSWVSSDPGIATVSDGIVVGVATGSTEIIAKCGNATAKCAVTVVISAKGISLDKTSLGFKALNQTETLTATVDPAGATDKLEWASSNNGVATVVDGVVTSVAPGTAEITATCGNASAKCSVTVKVAATAISLSKGILSLTVGDSETLTATVAPANTTDILEWSSSAEDIAAVKDGTVTAVALGTATITAKAGSVSATCTVVVNEPFKFGPVDLGLSVKWANANLGASSLEDYGDYYAWGEIETKENYSWETYKWCNGSYDTLTKYNTNSSYGTVDNKTVIDPEDDVAHVKLGGSWRMPTDEEWTELMTKCTWTWVSHYRYTRVSGISVTSKVEGYWGNSIFLPAAGYRYDTSLHDVGSNGNYWSSSLFTDGPYYAWYVYFNSGDVSGYIDYRCYGFSVRPVSE